MNLRLRNLLRQRPEFRQDAPSQDLKFGGVVLDPNNPGADIMRRSAQSAEDLYRSYSEPKEGAGEILARAGIKPNEQFPFFGDTINIDKNLERERTRTQIDEARARTDIAQQNADARGWKIVNVTDPNNPDRTISMRYNEITGEKQPITAEGVITRTQSPKDLQARQDQLNQRRQARENVKLKAQDALKELSLILNPDNTLNPEVGKVIGWSRMAGHGWTPTGQGNIANIERLRNMLTLDLIGEMKNQSRTGATGFGQMNIRELGVLENAASKLLTRGMSDEQYQAELNRIREKLEQIITPGEYDKDDDTDTETDTTTTQPAVDNTATNNGRIRVRNKQTGQTGTISAGAFNPEKYERIQ